MSLNILLVEDDADLRESVCEILEMTSGHTVKVAEDGLEALLILARFQPDLILMDFEMPRLTGLETVRLIREKPEWAEIPIVFMTGHTGRKLEELKLEVGSFFTIVKPFDVEILENIEDMYISHKTLASLKHSRIKQPQEISLGM